MSDGGGSGAVSTGEYRTSIPTGKNVLRGEAKADSKPCQILVDVATLMDDV